MNLVNRLNLWWLRRRRAAKLGLIDALEHSAVQAAGRRDLYAAHEHWDAEYAAYAKTAGDLTRAAQDERIRLGVINASIRELEAA